MPLHDWSKTDPGLWQHFRQHWMAEIARVLNEDLLPKSFSALLERRSFPSASSSEAAAYAARANRIVVKRDLRHTVAVLEIVTPGEKHDRASYLDFVGKSIDFLRAGIHLLVIDPFPPSHQDHFGMLKAIWEEVTKSNFDLT